MDNESRRLAAVQRLDLMDTPPEPEFDELVAMAAAICEVPISLLTLLDDKRQWFKAAIGIAGTELPIEFTFCQYTIRQDDLLIVEDTIQDELFVSHPAVVGDPAVRFYAGICIKSSDGFPVGTICVADLVPRQISETQIRTLRVLARHANALIELREQRRALQRALTEAEQARADLQRSQADLEAAITKLSALAATDPLTGIANRRTFDERLAAEFALACRKSRPLSVVMIDVDNFKELNDCHGHEVGDFYLKRIASLLSQTVRENDLVARYGGEEFVLLLPDTDEPQAVLLGQRILKAMQFETWNEDAMTLSGGVAERTVVTCDPQQLMATADDRLYTAKRAGKNRLTASRRYQDSVKPAIALQSY